jgi:transposase-like protein
MTPPPRVHGGVIIRCRLSLGAERPKAPYNYRYIGTTNGTVETRLKYHRGHRKAKRLMQYNADLAEWLQEVTPLVEVIAEVPESERFTAEAKAIRAIGKSFPLLNKIHNGFHHTPETRARISEANKRRHASRQATADTLP